MHNERKGWKYFCVSRVDFIISFSKTVKLLKWQNYVKVFKYGFWDNNGTLARTIAVMKVNGMKTEGAPTETLPFSIGGSNNDDNETNAKVGLREDISI